MLTNIMKIKFFFKQTKHRKFFYSPRYYDERKERLEKKKAMYQNLTNLSDEERKEALRDQIQNRWNRTADLNKQKNAANSRTIILILAILVLGYFVFNGLNHIEKVIHILF